jgi:hypothetical protein
VQDREIQNCSAAVARLHSFQFPLLNSLSKEDSAVICPPKELSFRSAALSREESAVSLPVANRFLADKTGFGMTRIWLLLTGCTTKKGSRSTSAIRTFARGFIEPPQTKALAKKRVSGKRQMRAGSLSKGPSPPESGS